MAGALLDRATDWGEERYRERIGPPVDADNDRAWSVYDRREFGTRRLKLDRPLWVRPAGREATRDQLDGAGFEVFEEWDRRDERTEDDSSRPFFLARLAR